MHLALALCLSALAQTPAPVENVSTFAPRSPFEERKALHVPEGFEVQLVAAEPAIQKPMNIAFDDRGRLWVTGTVEYPYPAPEGTPPRDTVKILEDFQPDGRAGKISTFTSGLNIPIGILPLTGGKKGALVYSIPTIDQILDKDGDGKADSRETMFRKYGFRDTHGMTGSFTWGIDGWVYACHGFSNDSSVSGTDDDPIRMNSGNIYRMKPDGSHAEYFTHGQVNPFGLSFDPLGNLYSSDCHSKPLYQLLRGAYYPSFGKPDDGLGFGPDMMSHDHGSTAIDGATYYAADQFPPAYRDTLFVGNVMTNRVNHDRLEWDGSSPRAIAQPDFVWSEDNWFRPVDIELGPDGALYIADFYNRIIGHYEVPLTHPGRDHDHGRIWRIVYRGPDGKGDSPHPAPDLTKATASELIEKLGDPNLVIRTFAANLLTGLDDSQLDDQLAKAVASKGPIWRRVHALWVLQRRNHLDPALLIKAASDTSRELRVHAMRVFAEQKNPNDAVAQKVRAVLSDPDPMVRRTAAEALGRHPETANLRPILDVRQQAWSKDTHLIHTVRMALRDQLRKGSDWGPLEGTSLSERDMRDIADVATGVPIPESAAFLLKYLDRFWEAPQDVERFVHHIARYGDDDTSRGLLAYVKARSGNKSAELSKRLKVIQKAVQERGGKISDELRALALDEATKRLGSSKEAEVLVGIDLAKTFSLSETREKLESFVKDAKAAPAERVEALTALVALDSGKTFPLLSQVLGDESSPLALRERAAQSLSGIDRDEARDTLVKALPTAPDRIQSAIAIALAARKTGAEALLTAIAEGKASARLLQEQRIAQPLANQGIAKDSERIAALLKGLPPADQKLRDLVKKRRAAFNSTKANPTRGANVFEKNCAVCHQLGGKGQRIGPQLDGVGVRGIDRLLEDVLDPNRNVDQAFRTTNLAQKDGQITTGLLLKEEGAVLVLADAQGKEVRVPQDQVEERSTSQMSPMPANLSEQVAEPDFYDLLAYLLLQRDKAAAPEKQ